MSGAECRDIVNAYAKKSPLSGTNELAYLAIAHRFRIDAQPEIAVVKLSLLWSNVVYDVARKSMSILPFCQAKSATRGCDTCSKLSQLFPRNLKR